MLTAPKGHGAPAGCPAGRPSHLACVVVEDGFSLFSFAAVLDAFRIANQCFTKQVYGWRVVGLEATAIVSSGGVKVTADATLGDVFVRLSEWDFDSVFVLSASCSPYLSRSLSRYLNIMRNAGTKIVGVERGVFELARAGLVTRGALHWDHVEEFVEEFGSAVTASSELFTDEPNVATCAGGSAVVDVMAHLLESRHGLPVAAQFCEKAIVDRIRPKSELQFQPLQARHPISHSAVADAITLMKANISPMISLDDIAFEVGVSRRQLERLFKCHANCSPSRYYQSVRLEHSRSLLSRYDTPIAKIAIQCGFVSPSHFSKAYHEHFGFSPRITRLKALHRSDKLQDANGNSA